MCKQHGIKTITSLLHFELEMRVRYAGLEIIYPVFQKAADFSLPALN